jgi:hypothetical protein
MFSNPHSRKPIFIVLSISAVALLLILGTHFALAKREAHPVRQEITTISPTGYGDDGIFEVGVEWIDVFPDPADNRSYWDESCDGLYNRLVSLGWKPRFHFTNYDVWETDAKNESLGGQEDIYVDNVDIAMICTHGSSVYYTDLQKYITTVFYGSTHNDQHLSPLEAYMAYGDKDLEFLAIDSCSILRDDSFIYWASTFNGLHLLLGFLNNMHVDPYGDGALWGYFMTSPYPTTVTQAWFLAIDFNQPSDTCARIIGEASSNYNNYRWNTSPDPIVDSEKLIWDHCSHGIIYGLSQSEQQDVISMPVVQILDRTVNEDYIREVIAPAFNMTGEIGVDDMFYYMADTDNGITRTLLVDPTTGSYNFYNLSRLWTTPIYTPTLPTELEAAGIIDTWFNSTPAEGLPAMQYRNPTVYEYRTEDIVGLLITDTIGTNLEAREISRLPADVSMIYPRLISVATGTTSGTQQVNFPIFGPGANIKIYLGDGGEIIGAQGGSRDAQVMSDQVNILNASKVWEVFLTNPSITIPEVSWVGDYITYTSAILGYYEMPYLQHQNELIPVWDFTTDFYSEGELIEQGVSIYVPATLEYLPPQVTILSPADGSTFRAGEPITFEGWINGGTPPYAIEWTSSSDGYLGNTLNIVSGIGSEVKSGEVFKPTVSFQVTDANGLTSTATISLLIKPIFWMPLITK